MPDGSVGIFELDGGQLCVWRGPSGWNVSLGERKTTARFLDAALETLLDRPPELDLVLQILQWDAAPDRFH